MIEKLCSLKADFFYLNEKLLESIFVLAFGLFASVITSAPTSLWETVTLQIEIWKYLILITNKKYIREINT